ncbi:MAG: sigma-70 family RNA polymerase sigma factor [Deltaproteobacteria bacterium]|nr:sigma-70 family RNA polymerase sigma factor [Deltaproteobacteria bacterium]
MLSAKVVLTVRMPNRGPPNLASAVSTVGDAPSAQTAPRENKREAEEHAERAEHEDARVRARERKRALDTNAGAVPDPDRARDRDRDGDRDDVDISLCRRVARGDRAAFRTLVEQHQHRVYSFCFRLLQDRSEAEDVAQEVFMALHDHADSFRGESRFTTWLMRIAKNHTLNRIKYLDRRGRRRAQSFEQTPEPLLRPDDGSDAVMPDRAIEVDERMRAIRAAIEKLGTEQRVVLLLRHVDDLSYEEISEVTGLAIGTVKSRIHRGRSALAQELSELLK